MQKKVNFPLKITYTESLYIFQHPITFIILLYIDNIKIGFILNLKNIIKLVVTPSGSLKDAMAHILLKTQEFVYNSKHGISTE